MLKFLLSCFLFVFLVPSITYAQNVSQIRRGTPLYFDHDEQSILVTEYYTLCEDEVVAAKCHQLENVVRLQGTPTFQFSFPKWVTNGAHIYVLLAFGEGEYSDPSSSLTLQVTGKPLPPTNYRREGPPGSATSSSPSTPIPASVNRGLRLTP